MDVVICLGVTLANAGVIKREDLAATLDLMLDQQRQRDGDGCPGKRAVVTVVRDFFKTPVFTGEFN